MAVSTIPMPKRTDFVVEQKTVSVSLSNQRYKEATKDVAKTGYTPLGVVGYEISAIDNSLSQIYIDGTTLHIFLWRATNSTATYTVDVKVLYRSN